MFFGGLVFLERINTKVYTKPVPQYQTFHKCAVPTKPIFHHKEQVKGMFLRGKGFPEAPWMVSITVSKVHQ